jgi:Predicted permeases
MVSDLGVFYSSLATVVLIVILGLCLGKAKWISESTNKQLINILLMISMPCALFSAFPQEFDSDAMGLFITGFFGGLLVFAMLIIASKLLFNKKTIQPSMVNESQFALIFNNATFLGYPLVMTIFGEAALMPYCGFIITFNFALFSYGVYLIKGKFDRKLVISTLLNPNIIAVVLGVIFFIFSLKIPDFMNSTIKYVSGTMTPLSLICIGYMLSHAQVKKLWAKKQLFMTAAVQLTIGPLLTWVVLSLAGVSIEVRSILVLIQALPTATSLGLFAEKYGGDAVEASELVIISTLMSIVTLPIVIQLLVL